MTTILIIGIAAFGIYLFIRDRQRKDAKVLGVQSKSIIPETVKGFIEPILAAIAMIAGLDFIDIPWIDELVATLNQAGPAIDLFNSTAEQWMTLIGSIGAIWKVKSNKAEERLFRNRQAKSQSFQDSHRLAHLL